MRAWGQVVVIVVVACGPSSGTPSDGDTTTAGASTTSADDGPTTTTESEADSGAIDETSTAGGTSSTGDQPADPCLAMPPSDCGPECTPVVAWAQDEDACDLGEQATFCIALGEPLSRERTTFHLQIDDRTWYVFANQGCGIDGLPATPIHWTECMHGLDEPSFCFCGCAQDECAWEEELLLLQECGLPQPCGAIDYWSPDDGYTADEICVLTALRDRTTAAHASIAMTGETHDHHVFVEGNGARYVHRQFGGICGGPLTATWRPAESCVLKPPEYFDGCLQDPPVPSEPECLRPFDWFDNCIVSPAVCP